MENGLFHGLDSREWLPFFFSAELALSFEIFSRIIIQHAKSFLLGKFLF